MEMGADDHRSFGAGGFFAFGESGLIIAFLVEGALGLWPFLELLVVY
jgi:hypothetical protein